MILIYEYASNGSLDRHLSSTNFTWTQRLKTCLGAARGLSFLHDAKGTNQRVIHCDIKSANILLDENWNAKVSDMGLSKIAPANQQHTGLFTSPAGTPGYCDPYYMNTHNLKKEADVYSFGVVLFEVLCGRLCSEYINGQLGQYFVPMWKESYEQNNLQQIIFDNMKQQIDPTSLEIYSGIAYKCLQQSPKERPTMPNVVKELETALEHQEPHEGVKLNNNGKTWLACNMNGDSCEMISIAACLTSTASESQHYISSSEYTKRFAVGCYEPCGAEFKTHIKTQFLSPRIMYTVNLVFKRKGDSEERYIGLEYRLKGEEKESYSFVSDKREDGWLTAELYQFTCNQKAVDLEIVFDTKWCDNLLIESIEFCPVEKGQHEVLTDDKDNMQPISDTETYWSQKLPVDYKEIIKQALKGVQWRTNKELYYILCEGFLINSGKEWFSLAKDGKKCLMLPAKAVLEEHQWKWISEPESRFGQVADCISEKIGIVCRFSSKMLSPQTTYAAYLVYSGLPHEKEDINPPVRVVDGNSGSQQEYYIFFRTPQTPVISGNCKIKIDHNPSIRPVIKGLPKLRNDGWMEVQIHEFKTRATNTMISTRLRLSSCDMSLAGFTVQGLEFRPISL